MYYVFIRHLLWTKPSGGDAVGAAEERLPSRHGTPPSGLLVSFFFFFVSRTLVAVVQAETFSGLLPFFHAALRYGRFVSFRLSFFFLFLLAVAGCRACPMHPRPGHSFYLHIVLPFLFMHISALVYTMHLCHRVRLCRGP